MGEEFQDDGLDGYLDEVNTILAEENPPQVLTTSYGMSETAISFALTEYGAAYLSRSAAN